MTCRWMLDQSQDNCLLLHFLPSYLSSLVCKHLSRWYEFSYNGEFNLRGKERIFQRRILLKYRDHLFKIRDTFRTMPIMFLNYLLLNSYHQNHTPPQLQNYHNMNIRFQLAIQYIRHLLLCSRSRDSISIMSLGHTHYPLKMVHVLE